jgi:hypothetical protein
MRHKLSFALSLLLVAILACSSFWQTQEPGFSQNAMMVQFFGQQVTNAWKRVEFSKQSTGALIGRKTVQYFALFTAKQEVLGDIATRCEEYWKEPRPRNGGGCIINYQPKSWPTKDAGPLWWRPSKERPGTFFIVSTNTAEGHSQLTVFVVQGSTNLVIYSHLWELD